jgi:hypothetical protein
MKKLGFSDVLTLIFITLKLTEEIDWSWVWVLSPMVFGFIASYIYLLFLVLIGIDIEDIKNI